MKVEGARRTSKNQYSSANQKVKVSNPSLRGPRGEIALPSYDKLKELGQFSEEILTKMMSGL